MSERHKIVIIGTGRIIKSHVNAIKQTRGFTIAGIYGSDFERTREVASSLGLKPYRQYGEILDDKDIDVVDIASSSDLHALYGIEAARHGKNLIIEKPIDVSEKKALELIGICEKKGCLLGVIYQCRFDDSALLLRKLIKGGVFGKVITGSITWGQRRDLEYYQGARDGSKGVLINNGIHFIDLAVFLMDEEPERCQGAVKITRPELSVEDQAEVCIEFKDASFYINMTTNIKRSIPTMLTIEGDKGSVVFEDKRLKSFTLRPPFRFDLAYLKFYFAAKWSMPFRFRPGTHYHVFRNYLNALDGRENVSVDGREALKSLKAVHAVYAYSRKY